MISGGLALKIAIGASFFPAPTPHLGLEFSTIENSSSTIERN